MSKVTIFLLAPLIIFLSSCSGKKTALDLEVSDCYVDFSMENLVSGDTQDLNYVDVVSCSEPHNFEVLAEFSSVPEEYRSLENPIDEVCFDATLNLIKSIHPNADDSSLQKIYEKYDEMFIYSFNYNRISISSMEPDLNEHFNCAIKSKNNLTTGNFKKIIESFN